MSWKREWLINTVTGRNPKRDRGGKKIKGKDLNDEK
jgi:hypothetical protein